MYVQGYIVNGCRIYVDIMTVEKNCRQFRMLTLSVRSLSRRVGDGVMGMDRGGIVISAMIQYMIKWCKIKVVIYPLCYFFFCLKFPTPYHLPQNILKDIFRFLILLLSFFISCLSFLTLYTYF